MPRRPDRLTSKYIDENTSSGVADCEDEYNPRGNADNFRWENAEVEEQDAALCETRSSAKENGGQEVIL